jgi:serine/threonine protein phosphatase PrpC
VSCASCGELLSPADRFCEACGEPTDLFALTSDQSRRTEEDRGVSAAVSDRGRVRSRNEDAYALAVEERNRGVVVCDGVATTRESGLAAGAAARAAIDHLRDGLGRPEAWTDVMAQAIHAAQAVLSEQSGETARFDGSTTIVGALAGAGRVVVGNVGDSRAYWVSPGGSSVLLTTDDTWQRHAIEGGTPVAVARVSPRAHEITGWLGPDAEQIDPHVIEFQPPGDGVVVVCSDGLWNYAESADAIGALVAASGDRGPVGIARHLVQFALEAGGADNVTVAVADASAAWAGR